MNGFHRGLEQYPTDNKDYYGETDFPCPRRLWTPPDQGQSQRPHRADCDYNKRFSEIPRNLFFCESCGSGASQKLAAVFTLYSGVLNIFGAEGTLFHYNLF